MQCGVAMLRDALSWFKKVKLEAGYVVVLETAGRSGHWNPHLHILMTSGGGICLRRDSWNTTAVTQKCTVCPSLAAAALEA